RRGSLGGHVRRRTRLAHQQVDPAYRVRVEDHEAARIALQRGHTRRVNQRRAVPVDIRTPRGEQSPHSTSRAGLGQGAQVLRYDPPGEATGLGGASGASSPLPHTDGTAVSGAGSVIWGSGTLLSLYDGRVMMAQSDGGQ